MIPQVKFVFIVIIPLLFTSFFNVCSAQVGELSSCNITWNKQSRNSSESMPCGGGDIGLNVWVENGDILFYMAQSGTFDENNAMLKLGRIRLKITPEVFDNSSFQQQLNIRDGNIIIKGKDVSVKIWVDVFKPVIHADVKSEKAVSIKASYETWRYKDHLMNEPKELRSTSYKVSQPFVVITYKDSVQFANNSIVFNHRNRRDVNNIFDYTVHLEGMDSVKSKMFNPIADNTFGGMMYGEGMKQAGIDSGRYASTNFRSYSLQTTKPVHQQNISIILHTAQTCSLSTWMDNITAIRSSKPKPKEALSKTINWWHQYWSRSYIYIKDADSSLSINYQLFRYMLGCNAKGKYPTKFNGGLFTFDPVYVDTSYPFSPDFRLWDGGTFTAQNQRLVYFGLLKSGDYDVMQPQFHFYKRIQKNAELRSKVYWQHGGGCYTEQIENFGLPNIFEYGLKRPVNFDAGVEYNAWLEYSWETVFEFCNMMLETHRFNNDDISNYIPVIESCLQFYDEHYQMLAKERGRKTFDSSEQYVFYPTSAAETYKMAYNSTTVIAALKTVLEKMLELPPSHLDSAKRNGLSTMLKRIPPISFTNIHGFTTIAPAQLWQRVQNSESPQLYPVFPWGIYGIGKPGLDTAINTYLHDSQILKNKGAKGWRQENIFAARLGLTEEAYSLTKEKWNTGKHRFPAFYGPGYDWTPDHNWGGTAMIGLQEMLLQADDEHVYVFPAWPKEKDVQFKLHAPYNTIVEASLRSGKVEYLHVTPGSRVKDVVIMLK